MKSKITENDKSLEEISQSIRNFLKPYEESDSLDVKLSHQVVDLINFLYQAETNEELDFYIDTIDRILTIIADYYLNLEEYKRKLLQIFRDFEKHKINYNILKNEFFSYIEFFKESNKGTFCTDKMSELQERLSLIETRFTEIDKSNISNDKDQAEVLKKLGLPFSDIQNFSSQESKEQEKNDALTQCRKSIHHFHQQRSTELQSLSNNRKFLVTAATTLLTVATSTSVGSDIADLTTNLIDFKLTLFQFLKKITLKRTINFACSAIGIICLFLPLPGTGIIGGLLLGKTILDLSCNIIAYVKKTIDSERMQKRTLSRIDKTEIVFNSLFANARKSTKDNPRIENHFLTGHAAVTPSAS